MVPTSRTREWLRLRRAGMLRITHGEFLCVCGKWHAVVIAGTRNLQVKRLTTGEEMLVLAARQSRMFGCPKTEAGREARVSYGVVGLSHCHRADENEILLTEQANEKG